MNGIMQYSRDNLEATPAQIIRNELPAARAAGGRYHALLLN